MKLHVKIFAIASICSLGAGAVPTVGQTQTRPMPAVETGTVQDQLSGEELRQAEEDLAQGFETLFTEVCMKHPMVGGTLTKLQQRNMA